jgi:superfamily II DNA or RNA helicase
VLTERNEHLERLAGALAPAVRHVVVLRGGMGKREFQAVADRLAKIHVDEERVLLATGRYAGEGFDDARLDTLFLTLPVSWRGTIAQYTGRLHRLNDRKRQSVSMTMPILMCRYWRECSIGVVADTER